MQLCPTQKRVSESLRFWDPEPGAGSAQVTKFQCIERLGTRYFFLDLARGVGCESVYFRVDSGAARDGQLGNVYAPRGEQGHAQTGRRAPGEAEREASVTVFASAGTKPGPSVWRRV